MPFGCCYRADADDKILLEVGHSDEGEDDLLQKARAEVASLSPQELKRYSDLKSLREFYASGDVALVKASFFLELASTGQIFPRRQDLPRWSMKRCSGDSLLSSASGTSTATAAAGTCLGMPS